MKVICLTQALGWRMVPPPSGGRVQGGKKIIFFCSRKMLIYWGKIERKFRNKFNRLEVHNLCYGR